MHAAMIPLAQNQGSPTGLLISLVLMGAIFYFLLIRPQQRRARQQRELVSSLEIGDEVVTVGGMYGRIRSLDEDAVTVEVSPGVAIRFLKTAIARKVTADRVTYEGDDQEGGATAV